jgi:hypothetical protein
MKNKKIKSSKTKKKNSTPRLIINEMILQYVMCSTKTNQNADLIQSITV